MFRRQVMLSAVLAVGGLLGWLAASGRIGELFAQQTKTDPASAEGTQLPKPDPEFKGKIGETYKDSKQDFPQPLKTPEGAPNVIVILLDDVGFGQPSTFGGPIPTPQLDKLASQGLKYTRFHTTGICSPTRGRC